MASTSRIVKRDNGAKKRLEAFRRASARPKAAKVGIIGNAASEAHEGGQTNVEVGSIHEFGGGNVPERSFIRAWVDEARPEIENQLRKVARHVALGGDYSEAMGRFGLWAEGEIKKRIQRHIPPKLSPVTIARKNGKETPLIDSGQLWGAILHELVSQ